MIPLALNLLHGYHQVLARDAYFRGQNLMRHTIANSSNSAWAVRAML